MVMPERVRVVVSGAGPAGMLAAINMLRRNHAGATVEYEVHLVDPGEDYGMLTPAGLEKKRSWMIGLSAHGITALKRVPKLFDEYVRAVGVPVTKNAIYIGATKLTSSIGENEVLLVDRNFVVAAMARFLNDHFKASGLLHLHYTHRLLYVDPDVRRVCVRSAAGSDSFLPYDLLLGCDGIRSNVRAALIRDHREFCCSIQDIFSFFKSVHIPLPKGVEGDAVHVTPEGVKGMNGIGLPETGGKINFAMGYYIDQPPDEALLGTDAEAVAAYLRKAFKAFPLPYEDFARQWVAQSWSTTGQVHCSFYHSMPLKLLLLGDAAHATSPAIGQGMNTALADAAALDELLTLHKDELSAVLPAYSAERVKEGNALTSLSFYAYSMSASQQLRVTLGQIVRNAAHKLLPSLFAMEPGLAIANGGKLSAAYDALTKMGTLPAVRAVNDARVRRHFEESTGMVLPSRSSYGWLKAAACAAGVAIGGAALASGRYQ